MFNSRFHKKNLFQRSIIRLLRKKRFKRIDGKIIGPQSNKILAILFTN